jgi:hypothetical protein
MRDPRNFTGPHKDPSIAELDMGKALRKHGVVFDDYDNYRGYWILKIHPEYKRLMALCILVYPNIPREPWTVFDDPPEEEIFTINIGTNPVRDFLFEKAIDNILGLPHRRKRKKS